MSKEDKQKLIHLLKQWRVTTNPYGLGLAIDQKGFYYLVGYAGMGSLGYILIEEDHHFYQPIIELIDEGNFTQKSFRPAIELGFQEVAELEFVQS